MPATSLEPSTLRRITALIVDDEPLARERMRTLLLGYGEIDVVGEAHDGLEAVEAIREHSPDLVFLDVEMPRLDAFGVIEKIGADQMPHVVFITAYDEFAIRAFDANAVDYLLKPVGPERLSSTLQRVRSRIQGAGQTLHAEILALVANGGSGRKTYKERFAVRGPAGFHVVLTSDILWVEAADNYVRLHTSSAHYLFRSTISELQAGLDPTAFVRVHRSSVIGINAVQRIEPWGMGEFVFVLSNGAKVSSSRRYREEIRRVFGC